MAMAWTRATGQRGEGAWDGKEVAWARRVCSSHRVHDGGRPWLGGVPAVPWGHVCMVHM